MRPYVLEADIFINENRHATGNDTMFERNKTHIIITFFSDDVYYTREAFVSDAIMFIQKTYNCKHVCDGFYRYEKDGAIIGYFSEETKKI